MQLGTRWNVGEPPSPRLDADVVEAILAVEAELTDVDTTGWRWTLTWLEGRPVCQLDDGTTVRVRHDGSVAVSVED